MISFDLTRSMSFLYASPCGSGSGKSGAGTPPFCGGSRAENNEITPRVLSMSCRSMTRSRSFCSEARSSSD